MRKFLAPSADAPSSKRQSLSNSMPWACSKCTFLHEGFLAALTHCSICETSRGQMPATPNVASDCSTSEPAHASSADAPPQAKGTTPSMQAAAPSAFAALMQRAAPAPKPTPPVQPKFAPPAPPSKPATGKPSAPSVTPTTQGIAPSAFAALMQGARQAARMLQWTLVVDEIGHLRSTWSPTPMELTHTWSCEVTAKVHGVAHRIKMLAPGPTISDVPPPPAIRLPTAALAPLVSLLKSAVQKNVRRCRSDEAVTCARALLRLADAASGARTGEMELLRRLPILFVEDAIPHPTMLPVVTWLMAAHSKGFPLSALHHAYLLDAVRACAATRWREVHAAPPRDTKRLTLNDAADAPGTDSANAAAGAMVGALLVRAAFGGMKGDVRMLEASADIWWSRLIGTGGEDGDVSPAAGGGEWWHAQLGRAFAREVPTTLPATLGTRLDAAVLTAACPLSAVDFHISNVLETFTPAVRQSVAAAAPTPITGNEAMLEMCRAAMWEHSSSTSFKASWRNGMMPSDSSVGDGGGGNGPLLAVWAAIAPACERFASEHIGRFCGPRAPLIRLAAAAAVAEQPPAAGATSAPHAPATTGGAVLDTPSSPPVAFAHPELPGLYLVHDFITPAEEGRLLRWLDAQRPGWVLREFNGPAQLQAWGVRTDLKRRTVELGGPMPLELRCLTARMREVVLASGAPSPLCAFEANEANGLRYRKAEGHYLGAHVDDRALSGDVIINLSLAGDATMSYTHDRDQTKAAVRVSLPRRSLQIQSQEVRFSWRHGIAREDLPDLRVSITFRRANL